MEGRKLSGDAVADAAADVAVAVGATCAPSVGFWFTGRVGRSDGLTEIGMKALMMRRHT